MLKKVEKRVTRIEKENSGYNLASCGHFKSEILAELRRVKYKDIVHMVYRMKVTFSEIVDILNIKNNAGSSSD